MREFKVLKDKHHFYIGLGDTWMENSEFGDRPILTSDCMNSTEWNWWCDELIKDINRVRKLGIRQMQKVPKYQSTGALSIEILDKEMVI